MDPHEIKLPTMDELTKLMENDLIEKNHTKFTNPAATGTIELF